MNPDLEAEKLEVMEDQTNEEIASVRKTAESAEPKLDQ